MSSRAIKVHVKKVSSLKIIGLAVCIYVCSDISLCDKDEFVNANSRRWNEEMREALHVKKRKEVEYRKKVLYGDDGRES